MSGIKPLHISVAIELIAGIYLLAFDKLLLGFGVLHWFGLLIFLLLNALLFLGVMGYLRGSRSMYAKAMSAINFLGFMLFILDAALGLPFTKFNPGISFNSTLGWSYLFGFGTNSVSLFSTSLAFTILLVMSLITGVILIFQHRRA